MVERERSGPAKHERRECRQVQKVRLVTRRSELRSRGRHLAKLDRTEAVGKVHSYRRNQENRRQWQADEGYPRANEDRESA